MARALAWAWAVTLSCGGEVVVVNERGDGGAGGAKIVPTTSTGPLTTSSTTSAPVAGCGNGVLEAAEACDDGNAVNEDDCTNLCTKSVCGDGIVSKLASSPEDCDPNAGEAGGYKCPDGTPCPSTCFCPYVATVTVVQSSVTGCDCSKAPIFAGAVTNATDPTKPANGVSSIWTHAGKIGINAGNQMCGEIGADHVCEWGEVKNAAAKGELASLPMLLGTVGSFWVHRVVELEIVNNMPSQPGLGGRCNEWTYGTNHLADGEYCSVGGPDPGNTKANDAMPPGYTKYGPELYCYFDQNTCYTGNPANNCQGQGPYDAGPCSGPSRAILCCFPKCIC